MIGKVLGPYRVVDKIGEGGMGEVYRATDTQLGRDVALKVLPEGFARDADRLARFQREAKTLAALNHPHIAIIHGLETAGGVRALVMELVDGSTLAERLAHGAIPPADALDIARQIAEALEAAHNAGIVHRDLKPANIKIRPDGTVKVLDFGLAKATESSQAGPAIANSPTFTSPAMTEIGIILGTAAYMAPEQARGKPVDKRADIWAFGCVLYEMLTGGAPFPGETVTDVLAAIVKNDPDWTPLPVHTPPRIQRLLRRCLQKDPRDRLRDIGDARLEILDREPEPAIAPAITRRSSVIAIGAAALAALVVGLVVGASWPRTAAPAPVEWNAVLVGGPASVLMPKLSPDGQLLAFQTIVDGQSQIAVMKPDTASWRVLTTDRTRGLVVLHDWSADGSRIFYDRQTDTFNGIYAVAALGGEERLVLENAAYPVTLPNGDLLVQRVNANRQSQLHRFSPSTGRVDPLPAVFESGSSDDCVLPIDGTLAIVYGMPLDKPTSPAAFYRLDLATGALEPFGVKLNQRPPISLVRERGTGHVLIGGIAGDAYQIVRVSALSDTRPYVLLTIPAPVRFDVNDKGEFFIVLRSRPAELFAFGTPGARDRSPQRLDTLPLMNTRELQGIAPLADGRLLVGSRGGERDRLLVIQSGGQPTPLVDGEEETRPPAAAVGSRQAALMMGPRDSPDIAIVNTADGRLVRRFKAPVATMGTLDASPDGRTLYYTSGGSVWALPLEGGTARRIGPGDSISVERETGDLIVKLDETERMRLVRMKTADGRTEEIPIHGDLRLIPRPLQPGAACRGHLMLSMATTDSWFWHAATIDLKTGNAMKLTDVNPSDFHFVTCRADGVPIGFGYALETMLWRFTAKAQ